MKKKNNVTPIGKKKTKKIKEAGKKKTKMKKAKLVIEYEYTLNDNELQIEKMKVDNKEPLAVFQNACLSSVVSLVVAGIQEAPKSKQPLLLLQTKNVLSQHINQQVNKLDVELAKLL